MQTADLIITLRAMEPEDLDELYEIENDSDTWNAGTTNVPYSRFVLRNYIANSTNDIYTDRQLRLIIEHNHSQTIGLIDLTDFDPRHHRAQIGIIIKPAYRHHGYAHAAIKKLLDYSHTNIGLNQIYACVDSLNLPSVRCFQSAGFRTTALLPQWLFDGETYRDALFMQYFL